MATGEPDYEERVCASLTHNSQSFTNSVYLNPEDPLGICFVEVLPSGGDSEGYVFRTDVDPQVPPGSIAMNGLQRKVSGVTNGFATKVRPFELNKAPRLAIVNLSVKMMSKRKATVEHDAVAETFKRLHSNRVLKLKTEIALEHDGVTFVVTVTNLTSAVVVETTTGSADKKDVDVEDCTRGRTIDETRYVLTPQRDQKLLEWVAGKTAGNAPIFTKKWDFQTLGIGGLDTQFEQIFRRAFLSRLFSAQTMEAMGINHTKGMLLYGPPGTGKTLIARQIGKILNGHEPLVVNGPEVLNKFVGASEENIRKLFAPAEEEQKEKGDASQLHIIIFDEIDAICKKRGSVSSGTGVHDTIVNQLLSKIDGVNSLNNILIIGMTNRKDLIDPALLRPGRLEILVPIGLPDEAGRLQIFTIHTAKMKKSGYLAKDVDLLTLAERTKNFSGAEIAGVVRDAASFALRQNVDPATIDQGLDTSKMDLRISMQHFITAIEASPPAFGQDNDTLHSYLRGGFFKYGPRLETLLHMGRKMLDQVRTNDNTPLLSLLLKGPIGCGKTAIAAHLALESDFPFVKIISPDDFVGYAAANKASQINEVFEDAYRSPLSLIVLDNIERLLDYVRLGNQFSNAVLQALMVLLRKAPPVQKDSAARRLMIIGTTNNVDILEDMQLAPLFDVQYEVPMLQEGEEVRYVLQEKLASVVDEEDLAQHSAPMPESPSQYRGIKSEEKSDEIDAICKQVPFPMGIKDLLLLVEMSRQTAKDQGKTHITAAMFAQSLRETGKAPK